MTASLSPLQLRLAKAVHPEAWDRYEKSGNDMAALSFDEQTHIAVSSDFVRLISPVLLDEGLPIYGSEGRSLGDDLRFAHNCAEIVADIIEQRAQETRGDLAGVYDQSRELQQTLSDIVDDIVCTQCGAFNNDGEGFDGLCGSCADEKESERHSRASDNEPTIGDKVAMDIDEDVIITIADIPGEQINLLEGIWTITDTNGDRHFIEDSGSRWETVGAHRDDVALRAETVEFSFDAQFEEEGIVDGEDKPARHWRGLILNHGRLHRSTACLYDTAINASIAAHQLHTDTDPLA